MKTNNHLKEKITHLTLYALPQRKKSILKSMITKVLPILLLFISTHLFSQSFTNPIYDLSDPHIIYHEGYYYATGTTGSSVKIKKAATLESLKSTAPVTVYSPSMGGPCCDYWAPEIHRLNDIWYIYYTAKETNTNHQSVWVLENNASDPLAGTWVNKGRIYDPSADYWAIDGTILNLNNENYFLWSGVAQASDGDKPQRIYIGKMTNPWTLAPERVLLTSPTLSWENNGQVNEAPEILKKNGKVFMVYSANGCWTPDYILGMLSMDQTADPMDASSWYKHPNPVFQKNGGVQVYGPGHHCFFKSPDGTEDWFAYHATVESSGACNSTRIPRAQKISWNEDGTPNFGIPLATGIPLKAPSGELPVPSMFPVSNGVYKIIVKASGQVIEIADCSKARGANVQQNTGSESGCQNWNIQATEGGYYIISNANGGLLFAVLNCSKSNGANIQTWTGTGSDCSQWSIIDAGGGYYQIKSKVSSKSLEVDLNTNNLQQYDYLGEANQQFQLIPVLGSSGEQAEDASYNGPDFKNENPGYNGIGYIDYANDSEDYITWTVNVLKTDNYNLNFRYALSSGNRPLELKVNGSVVVSSLDFPSTGSWTIWEYISTNQHLNSGDNTITLTAIGSSGPNVDELVVSSSELASLKIINQAKLDEIFAYPNPVKNILYINGLNNDAELRIVSLTGQLLLEERGKKINVNSLISGTYILKIKQENIIKSILIKVD